MRISHCFSVLIAAAALTGAACDGVDEMDDDRSVDAVADERVADEDLREVPRAEKPGVVEHAPDELSDDVDPASGPPGYCCFAQCGDDDPGWYNIGTANECNHRAAQFCAGLGPYSLIDAEWFPC